MHREPFFVGTCHQHYGRKRFATTLGFDERYQLGGGNCALDFEDRRYREGC